MRLKPVQATLSRTTLELTPPRALQFLRVVGTDVNIRRLMQQTGFNHDDFKQGWKLLLDASACPDFDAPAPEGEPIALTAMADLERWKKAMFVRARAGLKRLHPQAYAFVFGAVDQKRGITVLEVMTFLDRCDALESSPKPKATRKEDHAALATLERRGVTAAERKRARALIAKAKTLAPEIAGDPEASVAARSRALHELHAWVQDWSACAQTVMKRRDQLLRIGIGKRKPRASKSEDGPAGDLGASAVSGRARFAPSGPRARK